LTAGESKALTGAGGLTIFWQRWLPGKPPIGVVVIAHGAGEHSDRYAHVAQRLLDERFAVYAIEHRGHGRSQGRRGLIDRVDNAVADLDAVVGLALANHPGVPLFLLGHSMGGTLSLCYALRHQARLAGLILSGPLAALEAAPGHVRIAVKVLSAVAPGTPLVPIDVNLISRDPAVVKAYVADPLVYHGKLPVRTISELAAAIDSFPAAVSAITIPTLIMYGTDDGLCPPRGSVMLAESIGSSDLKTRAYEGLYHEILNEPEQDRVLDDMCSWLRAHVGAVAA
jgi:alpha-beta hydrolase superfamily lysophospholipase